MSTDRELLELAAKAAGLEFEGHTLSGNGCYIVGADQPWRPLTDDGDALRLAVKLDILVDTGRTFELMEASMAADPLDATRRAIVRAAAEIGRAMP